jgi:hypothetical protein
MALAQSCADTVEEFAATGAIGAVGQRPTSFIARS